jgi:hypothetical protein
MPPKFSDSRSSSFAIRTALSFLRDNFFPVVVISALLVVPCFWHPAFSRRPRQPCLERLARSADRASPNFRPTVACQWSNILFDLLILHVGNLVGFVVAEKIVASFAVLAFFWGCFSFLAAASGIPPWMLTPFLFVLSYGYALHMGFMNYYLSIGFAFFAMATAWGGGAGNWLCAVALSATSLLAHPMGFVLFVAIAFYVSLWRLLPRWRRLVLPAMVTISAVSMRLYFAGHDALAATWRSEVFLQLLGQDQLNLFGHRYVLLSGIAVAWGTVCVLAAIYDWIFRVKEPSAVLGLAIELYLLAFVTFCLPAFVLGYTQDGSALLVSRLTVVNAVFVCWFCFTSFAALVHPRQCSLRAVICSLPSPGHRQTRSHGGQRSNRCAPSADGNASGSRSQSAR